MAIGNPLEWTWPPVIVGVISGIERKVEAENVADTIQTDAAINPGNSGGAGQRAGRGYRH